MISQQQTVKFYFAECSGQSHPHFHEKRLRGKKNPMDELQAGTPIENSEQRKT